MNRCRHTHTKKKNKKKKKERRGTLKGEAKHNTTYSSSNKHSKTRNEKRVNKAQSPRLTFAAEKNKKKLSVCEEEAPS